MFDIMFMCQKAERNSAPHLNRTKRTVYLFGSKFKVPRGRELTRADALGHASTKQRCEIQGEAFEFSDEHKCLYDLN